LQTPPANEKQGPVVLTNKNQENSDQEHVIRRSGVRTHPPRNIKIFFLKEEHHANNNPIHIMIQSFKVHFNFVCFSNNFLTMVCMQVSVGEKMQQFGEKRNFPIQKLLLGD
jgi:hypothetical protein